MFGRFAAAVPSWAATGRVPASTTTHAAMARAGTSRRLTSLRLIYESYGAARGVARLLAPWGAVTDRTDHDGVMSRARFLRRVAGGGAALFLLGDTVGGLVTEAAAAPSGPVAGESIQHFVSRPDLQPPVVTVTQAAKDTADGLLFIAPNAGPGQSGNLIIDNAGHVVWFRPTSPVAAMNFRIANYKGEPVLTWWEGKSVKGFGVGEYVIADASYRELARFPAGNGRGEDQHEFLITAEGTALITSYERRTIDLRPIGGPPNATVVGGVVQELEIPSSHVLFEWRSFDHIGVAESRRPVQNPYDYFHVNSIAIAPDGDLLVSARNTFAVYKISRKDGRVIWRLGGTKSDFRMGRGTTFAWQHDARFHEEGRVVSIFDNAVGPGRPNQSRVIVLALDEKRMRATLEHEYTHRPSLYARAMGNAQLLDNGDYLAGWGTEPWVTEYAADGTVRFDARLPPGGESYRAFRFPWVGRPAEPPVLKPHPTTPSTLYASWNGSTELATWQLKTGQAANALRQAAVSPKRGFETALQLPKSARYAEAVALDLHGSPLGTSGPVRL
jgi:hypothetical protein